MQFIYSKLSSFLKICPNCQQLNKYYCAEPNCKFSQFFCKICEHQDPIHFLHQIYNLEQLLKNQRDQVIKSNDMSICIDQIIKNQKKILNSYEIKMNKIRQLIGLYGRLKVEIQENMNRMKQNQDGMKQVLRLNNFGEIRKYLIGVEQNLWQNKQLKRKLRQSNISKDEFVQVNIKQKINQYLYIDTRNSKTSNYVCVNNKGFKFQQLNKQIKYLKIQSINYDLIFQLINLTKSNVQRLLIGQFQAFYSFHKFLHKLYKSALSQKLRILNLQNQNPIVLASNTSKFQKTLYQIYAISKSNISSHYKLIKFQIIQSLQQK